MNNEYLLKDIAKQYAKTTGEALIVENDALEFAATPSLDAKFKAVRRRRVWNMHRNAITGIAAAVVVLVGVGIFTLPYLLQNNVYSDNAPAATQALPPSLDMAAESAVITDEAMAGGAGDAAWGGDFYFSVADDSDIPLDLNVGAAQTAPGAAFEPDAPVTAEPAPLPEAAENADDEPDSLRMSIFGRRALEGWQVVDGHVGNWDILHYENPDGIVVIVTSPPFRQINIEGFSPVLINGVEAYLSVETEGSTLAFGYGDNRFLTTTGDYSYLILFAEEFLRTGPED